MSARPSTAPSGLAVGVTTAAAIILIVGGICHTMEGFVGIATNEFYVVGQKWIFQFDVTTWGWIHVVMGALAVIAGIGWPPQVWRYRPRTPARGWWGSVWAARSAPGRGGLVVRSVAIPPGFMSHPDLSGIVTTPATRPV